jgi:hypothetical protein
MLPAQIREMETVTCIKLIDAYRELGPVDDMAKGMFRNRLLAILGVIVVD